MNKRFPYYLILPLLFSLLFSCKFNPNLQGKGEDYLQGTWDEEAMPYQKELLQYTRHRFKFSCDSFYVTMETRAKVNIYPDSCFANGRWLEYAKGTYMTRGDTLFLKGTFTKSNFKQKISGCYRIGVYKPVFLMTRRTESGIIMQSLQNHTPLNLTLKNKTWCTPKPLN